MPLTVAQVVGLPELGLALRTVSAPVDRIIRWVAVSELSDPAAWLDGGELLLTTGLTMTGDPIEAARYVAELVDADVAALGFGVGLSHARIPQTLVDAADAAGLPVIEIPQPLPFVAVGKAVLRLLTAEEYADSASSFESQRHLIRAALGEARDGVSARLVSIAARHVDGFAIHVDSLGAVVSASPRSALQRAAELAAEFERLRPRGVLGSAAISNADEHMVILPIGVRGVAGGFLAVGSPHPLSTADQAVINLAVSLLTWNNSMPGPMSGDPAAWRRVVLENIRQSGARRDVLVDLGFGDIDPARAHAFVLRGPGLDDAVRSLDGSAEVIVASDVNGLTWGLTCDPVPESLIGIAERSGVACLGISQRGDVQVAHGVEKALRQAQEAAISGRGVVVAGRAAPGGLIGLIDPDTAQAWGRARLEPLVSAGEGEQLSATLHAWLKRNGQVDAAASDLGVHRHTVRHRLQRIETLLEQDLDDARVRADLLQALSVVDSR